MPGNEIISFGDIDKFVEYSASNQANLQPISEANLNDAFSDDVQENDDIFEEETKIDPLLIDSPNEIDTNEEAQEAIDDQNLVLISGLPERNYGGRPAHGQLVCHICGFIAKQNSRLRAHIDSHSDEKKYKCDWTDQNGKVCDKKYQKQKELTAHQRLKKHRFDI